MLTIGAAEAAAIAAAAYELRLVNTHPAVAPSLQSGRPP